MNLIEKQNQVKIELTAMFRLTAHFGWDDTVWNHITARAPGAEHHFYMHKFGLMYEEVKASNLIKVDENGTGYRGTFGCEYDRIYHSQCSTSQPPRVQICFSYSSDSSDCSNSF